MKSVTEGLFPVGDFFVAVGENKVSSALYLGAKLEDDEGGTLAVIYHRESESDKVMLNADGTFTNYTFDKTGEGHFSEENHDHLEHALNDYAYDTGISFNYSDIQDEFKSILIPVLIESGMDNEEAEESV